MNKVLGDRGIEDLDQVADVNITRKPSKEEKEEAVERFNNSKGAKLYGVKAMNKTFIYTYMIVTTFIIIGLITIGIFLFNYTLKNQDFSTEIVNDIEVSSPDVPITNQYEHNIDNPVNIENKIYLNCTS